MLPVSLAALAAFSINDGNAYQPAGLRVAPGATVTFPATDGHPLAFDGEAGESTAPVERTYAAETSVAFYCKVHGGPGGSGMSGVLTVGNANHPPVVQLKRETETLKAGGTVVFRAAAGDPERIPFTLQWDLDGDGTYDRTGGVSAGASFPAGTHTVRVRVTDDLGATVAAEHTFTVPGDGGGAPDPPGGTPAPPGGAPPDASDRTPPELAVTAAKRLRAGSALRVRAVASEAADVVAELRTPRGARVARAAGEAAGARALTLRLRPSRHTAPGRLRLVVTATDAAGNAAVRRAAVQLRRRG